MASEIGSHLGDDPFAVERAVSKENTFRKRAIQVAIAVAFLPALALLLTALAGRSQVSRAEQAARAVAAEEAASRTANLRTELLAQVGSSAAANDSALAIQRQLRTSIDGLQMQVERIEAALPRLQQVPGRIPAPPRAASGAVTVGDLERLQRELDELRRAQRDANAVQVSASTAYDALARTLTSSRADLAALRTEIDGLAKQAAAGAPRESQLGDHLRKLERRLDELEQELQLLRQTTVRIDGSR